MICPDVALPMVITILGTGQQHSAEHGSIELEMIAHASHTHPYIVKKAEIYYHLEEVVKFTW